jgi:hypothetical protein
MSPMEENPLAERKGFARVHQHLREFLSGKENRKPHLIQIDTSPDYC